MIERGRLSVAAVALGQLRLAETTVDLCENEKSKKMKLVWGPVLALKTKNIKLFKGI